MQRMQGIKAFNAYALRLQDFVAAGVCFQPEAPERWFMSSGVL
jgi:hypothetical protein